MKKRVMPVMLLAVLSGCAPLHPSDCHKTSALGSCSSGRFSDEDEYGQQARAIKNALEAQLADRYAWHGKKCRLHLEFARDGKLKKSTPSREIKHTAPRRAAPRYAKRQRGRPSRHLPVSKSYDAFARSRFNMQGD